MIWRELLVGLDILRSEIRATKKGDDTVPADDVVVKKLQLLTEDITDWDEAVLKGLPPLAAQPLPEPIDVSADLAACIPDEPDIQEVVERAEGEGRMVIEKRKTPLVVRPPDVIEVLEKDLVK